MNWKLPAIVMLATLLSGCTTLQQMEQDQAVTASTATQMARASREPATSGGDAYFATRDTYWIGAGADARVKKPDPLPAAFSETIRFKKQFPVTLNYIAEHVTTNFGIPMVVTADAVQSASDTAFDPIVVLQQRAATAGATGLPPLPTLPGGAGGGVGGTATTITIADYEGPLKGFLDLVAARSGNNWRYEHGGITLFGLDTKIFRVDVLPGSTTLGATVSNQAQGGGAAGGGGGGGGGGEGGTTNTMSSGNTTTVAATIDQFEAINSAVQGMLSPRGKAVPVPSMSQIAVTDVPLVLTRIERYIGELNAIATTQVVLDVRLYSVDIRDEESYGIDWDLVWSTMGSGLSVGGGSPGATGATGAGNLNIGVISPSSPFNGSRLLVNALSSQGNVSEVTTAGVSTLSGQPVPVQVAEEITYAASVSTNLVPNVGSTTTITPGSLTTGFSMVALPVVTNGDELILQLQINLSTLREMGVFASGTDRVQQPQTDSRQLLQRAKLRSGQTLVLTGFEKERLTSALTGVGSPRFMGLGGTRGGQRVRTILVLAVTPRVSG